MAGFVGLMLPSGYRGAGRAPFARFVVVEELLSAGAPVQSAPFLLKLGTNKQCRRQIP